MYLCWTHGNKKNTRADLKHRQRHECFRLLSFLPYSLTMFQWSHMLSFTMSVCYIMQLTGQYPTGTNAIRKLDATACLGIASSALVQVQWKTVCSVCFVFDCIMANRNIFHTSFNSQVLNTRYTHFCRPSRASSVLTCHELQCPE